MDQLVVTFKVPELVSMAAEDEVRGALLDAPGVEEFDFDIANRLVKVVMNDLDAEPDVRWRLDQAGYRPQD